MWIFLNDAFLSIVHAPGDDAALLVRARRRGDLERVFPGAAVTETPHRDYRFRASLPREAVAEALAAAVRDLRYPNFKGSVRERGRHDAYLGVWRVMHRYQAAKEP